MRWPWLIAWLVLWSADGRGVAAATTSQSPQATDAESDWPVVISRLRQQLEEWPGHATTRKELAVAYNNYGVQLANQGQFTQAAQAMEEALRIDTSDSQFKTNLANVHLHLARQAFLGHQLSTAKDEADRAVTLNPDLAQAYALLGEIEYTQEHLREAKDAWGKALALDPSLQEVREHLTQLNQELPVESKFKKLSQAFFDIRYTGASQQPADFDVRDVLLRARREVGSDFNVWLTQKLVVLVYSAEEFRRLRQDMPDWVAGQYDGKIRVPLPNRSSDSEAVVRTFFHEYTHAIVHEVSENLCPTWFNEGLAEYEAWKHSQPPWTLLRQAQAKGALVPWAELSKQFSTALPGSQVALAYEESHNIVRYLVDRYGFWRMRQLLKTVAGGQTLEHAMTEQLHIKFPRLESDWKGWLQDALSPSTH